MRLKDKCKKKNLFCLFVLESADMVIKLMMSKEINKSETYTFDFS